ncbi:MAG: hypothetical protein ACI4U2_05410 [Christensenellaceae bacterium]
MNEQSDIEYCEDTPSHAVSVQWKKRKRELDIFLTVWNYIAIALCILYGVNYQKATGKALLPTLIYLVSALHFIFLTVFLFLRDSKANRARKKAGKRAYRILSRFLKLVMVIVALVSVTGTAGDMFFLLGTFGKVLSLIWLYFTLGVEISLLIYRLLFKGIKRLFLFFFPGLEKK